MPEKPTAQPMRYHGPGWTVEATAATYFLWAPQTEPDPDNPTRPPRADWSACWERGSGHRGGFRSAATPADALTCFPGGAQARHAAAALAAAAESFEENR